MYACPRVIDLAPWLPNLLIETSTGRDCRLHTVESWNSLGACTMCTGVTQT